jgi:hypothetical protein
VLNARNALDSGRTVERGGGQDSAISSHKIDQEIGTRMTGFKYSRHRPTPTRVRTLSKAVTRGHVVLIDV